MKNFFDLLARIFLSAIFIFEAYDSTVYFEKTQRTMLEYGITWQLDFLLVSTIIILTIGGLFLLIGYRSSFAAGLLLLYYIPVTFIVFSFWNDPKDLQRIHSIMFMKNIAIIGGLIHVMVHGTGKWAVHRFFGVTKINNDNW